MPAPDSIVEWGQMTRYQRRYTRRLRKAIERRKHTSLWGQKHIVKPRLVSTIFGDGAKLLDLRPLATRPNRYIVRIDSSWELSNHAPEGDLLYDHLDDIYDAIEDEFGAADEEDDSKDRPWPAFDHSCGCEWYDEDWPSGFRPRARR